MAASKSRLGRGLGGLIANASATTKNAQQTPSTASKAAASTPAASSQASSHSGVSAPAHHGAPGFIEIAVASILPSPTQARKDMTPEQLQELADSIAAEGLMQPIVVRKHGDKYQLIAGERRWRAFQLLKLKTIPARLTTATDSSAAVLGLIENLQREGLNPIEEALGYMSLVKDFKLTAETAAERVGKKRTTVANSLRLLQLDAELQGYVATNRLSVGHAKVILGLDDAAQRALLARRIIEEDISVRDTELLVQKHKLASPAPSTSGKSGSAKAKISGTDAATVAGIEKKLTSHFGSRVAVHHSPKKGRIVIEYAGNSDLQRILEKLGVEA